MLSCPIKMHRDVSVSPASQAPASRTLPPQETKCPLNLSHPSQNHRRLTGAHPIHSLPRSPSCSSFFLPLTSPSPPGMEGVTGLPSPGGVWGSGCRHPSCCAKLQGLSLQNKGEGVRVWLPTPFPPGCRVHLATPILTLCLIQRYTVGS